MKKIINCKMYNTETATYVDEYSYGNCGDFHYYREVLFKKKTGEFFLYGEGGAMTKYAKWTGENERYGGDAIVPLTEKEAREWVEEYCDADTYCKCFGEPEE